MGIFHNLTQWILPLALIVGGFFLGVVFEKIVLSRLRNWVAKTHWGGDEVVVTAMRGMTTLWFTLAGVNAALVSLPLSPSVLGLVQKILLIIFIFSATVVLARIAAGFMKLYSSRMDAVLPTSSIFTNLARGITFLIGILIILQSVGISITPILTALGVGGLAAALALQDTLANLFAGLQIILSREIRLGDYIKLDTGEEGYVTDITWRNTMIRMLSNNRVVIPNAKLASAIVTNFYLPEKEMAVLVQIGVSYASDLEQVEHVTIEVAKEVMQDVKGGIPNFDPFIRYHTFADSSINFSVILRGAEFTDQYLITHEFVKRLHQRYANEGIEIPFPIRTLVLAHNGADAHTNDHARTGFNPFPNAETRANLDTRS